MHVLVAVADVGQGVQLEEALNHAAFECRWDSSQCDGPSTDGVPDVVLIDADHLGSRLADVANAWRDQPSVPGVVALGSSLLAREHAPIARVTLISPTASIATITAAIHEAAKLRLSTGMRWAVLRAALQLPPSPNESSTWATTLLQARTADIEIARAALRWHVQHYVTPTRLLDQVRDNRILTVPELETIAPVDGTRTVQTHVKMGPLDPVQTARLLWTLTSMGALVLTPEVHDATTPARRGLDEIRKHLRGRSARLGRTTFYDVLEITPLAEYPEIEAAYQLVGSRYSPQALGRYELAQLSSHVTPTWELVEKARSVLVDHAARGKYHDWLRQHLPERTTRWALDPTAVKTAIDVFARGQRALGEGDAHRAMGDFAMACRHHPGHPDYEANLAWVRFRVQVESGKDQRETAVAERVVVEEQLLGCRPWPRALVALALLCAAGGDADAARWHLHIALSIDPNVPAAAQLAQRLGLRSKAATTRP